jgi:hypothetical protein
MQHVDMLFGHTHKKGWNRRYEQYFFRKHFAGTCWAWIIGEISQILFLMSQWYVRPTCVIDIDMCRTVYTCNGSKETISTFNHTKPIHIEVPLQLYPLILLFFNEHALWFGRSRKVDGDVKFCSISETISAITTSITPVWSRGWLEENFRPPPA